MSTRLKPSYQVVLGTSTISSSHLGPLAAILIRRDKRGGADEAILRLGDPAPDFETGDPAVISLGWDGMTSAAFTGTVYRIERAIDQTDVYCTGAQMALMRTRADQVFVNQTAGGVVSVLAGNANVPADTVDDGIDLPVYFVDSARTLFTHCLGLARLCGFDLYTTADGKLIFSAFSSDSADHTVRYGAEILAVSIEKGDPITGVTVVPESPASSAGDDKATWLAKTSTAHEGTAGSTSAFLFSDAVLRTRDAAESAAKAWLYFSQRDAVSGHVRLTGTPEVDLGETIAIDKVPGAGVNGLYQVMAVTHRLDARRGFQTTVALGGMP